MLVSRQILAAIAVVSMVGQASLSTGSQRSAAGSRGPAFLLLELPSGRALAESGGRILDTAMAPGSIVKLATLAAALESGRVTAATRILCRRRANVDGRVIECVHPDLHRPLDPVEALGHSCNEYFATIARQLDRNALNRMLSRLGLSPIDPGTPTVTGALGLAGVKATPRQLLEAFRRIAGASAVDFRLDAATRAVLRRGMEVAARSGTAAALAEAGFSGLAKTGTAPMPAGGYQGLVTAIVSTELPTHAIVVVAPGASGAYAAELAAGILTQHGVPTKKGPGPFLAPKKGPGPFFRVGVARRDGSYAIQNLELESYVGRAVAGEGGDTLPAAALEALAITVRTFAQANRGRHASEGFDLCDLTHCLALRNASRMAAAAAAGTRGLLLLDGTHPATLYLSASCGGFTERPSQVWVGAADVAYLPSRPDPACAGEPSWESGIREPQLRAVLRAMGLRGGTVEDLRVVERSASGRVRTLSVAGMVPERLDAETFRLAVGRVLGWQTLKSTLFDLERTSNGYRFVGKGHGHGVGLCVRGAAARASSGASREAILGFYFPGLRIGAAPADVRVLLPEEDRGQAPTVRRLAALALSEIAARLEVPEPLEIELRFHPTVDAYMRATGQPWWTSARASGARIDLLPLGVLQKRGTLDQTVRHEMVHVLTEDVLAGGPLWVREGLAQVMAGEAPELPAQAGRQASCPSDTELRDARAPEAWRDAYTRAAHCVATAMARGRSWREIR